MTMFLGFFNRRDRINIEKITQAFEAFSLSRQYMIDSYIGEHFAGAALLGDDEKIKAKSGNIAYSSDGGIILTISGEIQGYQSDLKKLFPHAPSTSVADYLLHRYLTEGEKLFTALNGHFGIAIFDIQNKKLKLINDLFGIFPLFVYHDHSLVIFGNELEEILGNLDGPQKIDYQAFIEFFCLGLPLGDKTLHPNIKNLCGGTILTISEDSVHYRHYASHDFAIDRTSTLEENAERVANCLREIVQDRICHHNDPTANLTGGADTRLILSCMTPEQRKQVRFVVSRGMGLANDRDVIVAQKLAKKAQLRLSIVDARMDQLQYYDQAYFQRKKLSALNNRRITGIFGGEFLGGCYATMTPVIFEQPEWYLKEVGVGKFQNGDNRSGTSISKVLTRKDVDLILEKFSTDFTRPFYKPSNVIKNSISQVGQWFTSHLPRLKWNIKKRGSQYEHPYDAAKVYYASLQPENKAAYFSILQISRASISAIYGGLGSGWETPYRKILYQDMIFLDPRLIKIILAIPPEHIGYYTLYNELYKNHFTEFNDIPANSLLTGIKSSVLKKINIGDEPKRIRNLSLPSKFDPAIQELSKNPDYLTGKIYNEKKFSEVLKNSNLTLSRQLVLMELYRNANGLIF